MSPNTSSFLVLLAAAADPKRPVLGLAEFPTAPPQISLPEASKDGCWAGAAEPQTFCCTGGTGLLQLWPTFQDEEEVVVALLNGGKV